MKAMLPRLAVEAVGDYRGEAPERRSLPDVPADGPDGRLPDADLAAIIVRAGVAELRAMGKQARRRALRAAAGDDHDARDAAALLDRLALGGSP